LHAEVRKHVANEIVLPQKEFSVDDRDDSANSSTLEHYRSLGFEVIATNTG